MKEWISLNMTPGVGPRKATQLLEKFGSPERVFHALRSELEELRLPPEAVRSILSKEFHGRAEREVDRVRRIGGDVLILDDGIYPQPLREIHDPPITLYVAGDWRACFDLPSVGVIGSRRCTTYGRNACAMLAQDLAERGLCIVSGFARGIDTAAHRGALQAGGRTIAVMGTGLDDVYPAENRRLADEILDAGGAVVTQFPLGTPPLRDNFPYRNRIISGLSLGVLVIEASERSGSLITARLAMEQDREVFAVPGNITSRNSFGTNYLIKSGAKLVQHWQDVVTELPEEIAGALLPTGPDGRTYSDAPVEPPGLTPAEKEVYSLLKPDEHLHKDELFERTGLSFGELNTALVALDLKDLLLVLPGDNYARRR